MTKKEIRAEMKKRRAALSDEEVIRLGDRISRRILETDRYASADVILSYYAVAGEVSLALLHKKALEDGKRVAFPVCLPGNRMEFRYIEEGMKLTDNAYHIPEPISGEKVCPKSGMLLIVPGVSFDEECNRIGYGGGFYDRFMAEYPELSGVMPAYEFQKAESIPAEATDIRVSLVVTEERTYCNTGIERKTQNE
ncbi:MAG: 5-formyltetrahydrofolate cyclo-ligase [Lachnospiraceae bacterium]|nr:5-formyltetrahydrofolate cyclo-ligase [Lachnospiraceae bacterium]